MYSTLSMNHRRVIIIRMKSFSWHTHEYVYREKTQDWFWVVGIISVAIAVTSIIFGNILFALVILIGAFVMALFAARKPNVVEIDINEKGIIIDKEKYPYHELRSFWIDETHYDGIRLVVRLKKSLMPYIMIPITRDDIDEIRTFLETKLDSEPFKESAVQMLFERLGF